MKITLITITILLSSCACDPRYIPVDLTSRLPDKLIPLNQVVTKLESETMSKESRDRIIKGEKRITRLRVIIESTKQ